MWLCVWLLFGTGFVCLLGVYLVFVCLSVCVTYVWHGVCLFVCLSKLCLAWGLCVCPSEQVMFGMGFVCLNKLRLAWGLSVCPSEQVMCGMGVCLFVRLYKLCLAWGLSVASIAH